MKRPDRNSVLNIAIAVIMALLLVLTLAPSRSGTIDFREFCLICGERGMADTLLNIALFMPLGLILGARIRSSVRAYALAVAISTSIEFAQVFIPGRDSSIADIVFNGLGAALGVGLARSWELWLLPQPRTARLLGAIAALGAVSVFAATDLLLRPAFPSAQYDASWTPRFSHRVYYEGSVIAASVGETSIPGGLLADSEVVRAGLLAGKPVRATVVAGAAPDGTAPLLSINGVQMQIASLSVDHFDLVFRYRMRSDALRLDRPQLRYGGAFLGVRPGQMVRVGAERNGKAYCMWVDDSRHCGLGFTLGDGWSLLLWSPSLPAWLGALLSLIWLALIATPAGFWAPGFREATAGAIAVGLGLVLVPIFGTLLATPWPQYLAASAGLALGWTLGSLVRRTAG